MKATHKRSDAASKGVSGASPLKRARHFKKLVAILAKAWRLAANDAAAAGEAPPKRPAAPPRGVSARTPIRIFKNGRPKKLREPSGCGVGLGDVALVGGASHA